MNSEQIEPQVAQDEANSGESVGPPSRGCILVANDQEWSARSIESLLTSAGYEVVRAFTGTQAIDQAMRSMPDACILDAQMPGLLGTEVARRLRQEDHLGPAVPIIITTAGPAGREIRREATEAGAWDFMTQPLDGELLLAKLDLYLGARRYAERHGRDGWFEPDTGILTERGLAIRAHQLVLEAQRQKKPIGVLVVSAVPSEHTNRILEMAADIRRTANGVATVLKGATRGTDVFGRLGGMAFGLLGSGLDDASIASVGHRYNTALQSALGPDATVRFRVDWFSVGSGGSLTSRELLARAMDLAGEA